MRETIKRILADIRVNIGSEFDKNFERQSFFSQAWQRRKSPIRGEGHILVDSGNLRRSVKSRSDHSSITFYTDSPYATIHNEGGEIIVTRRMKRFFWAKYYEASGGFTHRKDGSQREDRRNRKLTSEAEFWKAMALMKVGKAIKIPRRQFMGMSPEVEKIVKDTIELGIDKYIKSINVK